jgi:hypothetical protein
MKNVPKAIELLESTGKFISKYIESDINKEAYIEGIRDCVDAFEGAREHGYDRLKYLMKVGNDFVHTKKFKRSLFSNPKKYYRMAFQHATDIVVSIEKRFGDN